MGSKIGAICVLLSFTSPVALAATSDYEISEMTAERALEKGQIMRAQYKNIESRPYLKHAAEKQNGAASFLYAMEIANYKTTMRTPLEARQYLVKAAELGNRRAMHQLYTQANWLRPIDISYWKSQYFNSVILLGRDYPAQAMYELAHFHKDSDDALSTYYLDKAIDFNHPKAMMDRAASMAESEGGLLTSKTYSAEEEALYLRAAETKYIPAIKRYIDVLEARGRFEDAYQWRVQALESGDIKSLAVMSKILLGQSAMYDFIAVDKVKAKAYIDLYLSAAGQERMKSLYSSLAMDEESISGTISAEEKKQATEIYLKYKNTTVFYNHDLLWDIQ
ncbi:hypothetical protein VII00023_17464 [Vibrio ichthyoenteri ATCC 700023]|uniref:Sel1 repeat family protein n=2 Tax=Vibrio ichthyoenteri TaxID=142461 RepID=F9RW61_9VIBR|nr:hypothetical protein VII00023_17464 [Vibrio ichthyoenteri ATCC 700023]